MPDDNMLTSGRLKSERGWTNRLITKFLGEPDKLSPNPHYRNAGAPMRLYSIDRITSAEATEDFVAAAKKAADRRDSATLGVATKTANMLKWMQSAELTIIRGKSREEIKRLAIATHGGNYMGDPGEFTWSNRIAINCIRHNMTNYESLWAICNRGDTGQPAYDCLRERIDALITETYPEYFVEPDDT